MLFRSMISSDTSADSPPFKYLKLGLSATPGKDIKTINLVIEALRVSKIEARLDTDPDVKEYVHGRTTEIIKCEITESITVLNELFGVILNPFLDMIRRKSSSSLLNCAYPNISSFHLLQSRKDYNERHGDHKLDQYFLIAQAFLTVRERLLSSGIGVARNELRRFQTQFCNGLLGRQLMDSSPFQIGRAHV